MVMVKDLDLVPEDRLTIDRLANALGLDREDVAQRSMQFYHRLLSAIEGNEFRVINYLKEKSYRVPLFRDPCSDQQRMRLALSAFTEAYDAVQDGAQIFARQKGKERKIEIGEFM